jgi:predicted nuclease of restriction endonuclease-like (RecB) superfamily
LLKNQPAATDTNVRRRNAVREDSWPRRNRRTSPLTRTPPVAREPKGYAEFLSQLKDRIRRAQLRASLAVNHEMVVLYWQTGRDILDRQKEHGWGAKVIDQLSADLRRAFPGVEGFSTRNLKYIRAFAQAWPDSSIVQEALAQITWYHNLTLIEKVKGLPERLWYARKIVSTAGAATSSFTGSRAASTTVRARPRPTSSVHSPCASVRPCP